MCLAIPARIISICDRLAEVMVGSCRRQVYLLIDDATIGDWVLIYGGSALVVLEEAAALETLQLLKTTQSADG